MARGHNLGYRVVESFSRSIKAGRPFHLRNSLCATGRLWFTTGSSGPAAYFYEPEWPGGSGAVTALSS